MYFQPQGKAGEGTRTHPSHSSRTGNLPSSHDAELHYLFGKALWKLSHCRFCRLREEYHRNQATWTYKNYWQCTSKRASLLLELRWLHSLRQYCTEGCLLILSEILFVVLGTMFSCFGVWKLSKPCIWDAPNKSHTHTNKSHIPIISWYNIWASFNSTMGRVGIFFLTWVAFKVYV